MILNPYIKVIKYTLNVKNRHIVLFLENTSYKLINQITVLPK